MSPETLAALRGSISKWEAIVEGHGQDDGVLNCPLCAVFHHNECWGCPVMERTGSSGCLDSPYVDVPSTPINDYANPVAREYARELARAELDFLRSLLPSDA